MSWLDFLTERASVANRPNKEEVEISASLLFISMSLNGYIAGRTTNQTTPVGIANTEQGVASGIVNTSMQLGGALILAVATAVLGTSSVTAHPQQLLPHMDAALSVPAVATGLALAVTVARLVLVRRSSHAAINPQVTSTTGANQRRSEVSGVLDRKVAVVNGGPRANKQVWTP